MEVLEARFALAVTLPSLPPGSQYQLAFVTAATIGGRSRDVAVYNAFVADEAAAGWQLPQATWRAWVSTPTTNAKDNAPLYADVPIYNTRGELIAANSREFYYPTHRGLIRYDQFGLQEDRDVYTGSSYNGMAAGEEGSMGAGSGVVIGRSWDTATRAWVNSGTSYYGSDSLSCYVISSVITVPPTVPATTSTVIATVGNGAVGLTWQTPATDGGLAITDYVIQYRPAATTSDSEWTVYGHSATTATVATVDLLTNGVAYVFRVAAMNAVGIGAYSQESAPCTPLEAVIYVATGEVLVETGTYSGTQGRRKQGGGTLILTSESNSNSGATIVEGGRLIVRNTKALGFSSLQIQANARVTLDTGTALVSFTSLVVSQAALLDVGNGGFQIPYNEPTASTVRQLLVAGRNGGLWNGTSGINSNLAGTEYWSVGYAESNGLLVVRLGTAGDANLDGTQDVLDVASMLSAGKYNTGSASDWADGDFNYDGLVDILDIQDFLGAGLFNSGEHRTAIQSNSSAERSPELDVMSLAFAVMGDGQPQSGKRTRAV
jgi:autotransporter-associated beta strand protein